MGPFCAAIAGATLLAGCTLGSDVGGVAAAVNGTVDTDGNYPGVMGMFIRQGSLVARCTGVLVAPNLVLTARHCTSPTTGAFVVCGSSPLGAPYPASDALATTLVTMPTDDPSAYVAGAQIIVPPDGADECGFDIAAVILEGAGVEPALATPYPMRLDVAPITGELVTAVGYGTDGTSGLGTRRVHEGLAVACVGGADCAIADVQPTEWQAESGGFCRSDSGAPALDSSGSVLGIVSRGIEPCDQPILSSIPGWSEWLRSVGREAAAAGGYPAPAWTDPPSAADAGVTPDGGASMMDAAVPPDPESGGGCAVAASSSGPASVAWLVALLALLVRRRPRPVPR